MEIGLLGQLVFHKLFGKVAPFGCHGIRFSLNVDASYEVEYSGSNTPSHSLYLNDVRIEERLQTDLAKFLYSDPVDGCAPGGSIRTEFNSGSPEVACQYDLDESAHFHPTSAQVSDSFTVTPDATCDWKAEVDPLDDSWITGWILATDKDPELFLIPP